MVAEWRFRWHVTVVYRSARDSPDGWGRESDSVLYSVAELRALWLRHRPDPGVIRVRWWREHFLDGAYRESCPAGHEYPRWRPGRRLVSPYAWHLCVCDGHAVAFCDECGTVAIGPPLRRGCDPWPGPERVVSP